jgi:hypothetical protein
MNTPLNALLRARFTKCVALVIAIFIVGAVLSTPLTAQILTMAPDGCVFHEFIPFAGFGK